MRTVDRGLGDSECQAFTPGRDSCWWLSGGGGSERSEDSDVCTWDVGEAPEHPDDPRGVSSGKQAERRAQGPSDLLTVDLGALPADGIDVPAR